MSIFYVQIQIGILSVFQQPITLILLGHNRFIVFLYMPLRLYTNSNKLGLKKNIKPEGKTHEVEHMGVCESKFYKSVNNLYGDSTVPTMVIGTKFEVLWANKAAEKNNTTLTQHDGFLMMLSGENIEAIQQKLHRGQSVFLERGSILHRNFNLEISPCMDEENQFSRAIVRVFLEDVESYSKDAATQKMISSFVSQFRSPISAIYTVLIPLSRSMRSKGDTEGIRYLNLISQNIYRMLRATIQTSEMMRYNSASNLPRMEYDNFTLFLKELCDASSIFALSLGVMLKLEVKTDCPIYTCFDKEKVSYAILNLIINSCEHQSKNVIVSLDRLNDQIVLSVKDDGEGMDEEALVRATEPFYSQNSNWEQYKTLGLGLTLVRYTASAHGGTVTINSAQNQGTTVTMTLKIANAKASDDNGSYLYQNIDEYMSDRFSPIHIMFGGITDLFDL